MLIVFFDLVQRPPKYFLYLITEDIVISSLDYWLQNGCLTISIECVWVKEDIRERGGAIFSPSRLTLKMELEVCISNQMSLL